MAESGVFCYTEEYWNSSGDDGVVDRRFMLNELWKQEKMWVKLDKIISDLKREGSLDSHYDIGPYPPDHRVIIIALFLRLIPVHCVQKTEHSDAEWGVSSINFGLSGASIREMASVLRPFIIAERSYLKRKNFLRAHSFSPGYTIGNYGVNHEFVYIREYLDMCNRVDITDHVLDFVRKDQLPARILDEPTVLTGMVDALGENYDLNLARKLLTSPRWVEHRLFRVNIMEDDKFSNSDHWDVNVDPFLFQSLTHGDLAAFQMFWVNQLSHSFRPYCDSFLRHLLQRTFDDEDLDHGTRPVHIQITNAFSRRVIQQLVNLEKAWLAAQFSFKLGIEKGLEMLPPELRGVIADYLDGEIGKFVAEIPQPKPYGLIGGNKSIYRNESSALYDEAKLGFIKPLAHTPEDDLGFVYNPCGTITCSLPSKTDEYKVYTIGVFCDDPYWESGKSTLTGVDFPEVVPTGSLDHYRYVKEEGNWSYMHEQMNQYAEKYVSRWNDARQQEWRDSTAIVEKLEKTRFERSIFRITHIISQTVFFCLQKRFEKDWLIGDAYKRWQEDPLFAPIMKKEYRPAIYEEPTTDPVSN